MSSWSNLVGEFGQSGQSSRSDRLWNMLCLCVLYEFCFVVKTTLTSVQQWRRHWQLTLNRSVLSMHPVCLMALLRSVSEIKKLFGLNLPERLAVFLGCVLLYMKSNSVKFICVCDLHLCLNLLTYERSQFQLGVVLQHKMRNNWYLFYRIL